MESDKEVIITLETLFDLLRREKEREDLQKLDDSFFGDVVNYLKDKRQIMLKAESELFAEEEKEKTTKQLANLSKILREFYERREKKIISMALAKSRIKSSLIDASAFLDEEKMLFDQLLLVFDNFRDKVLFSVLNEKLPLFEHAKEEPEKKEIQAKETKTIRFLSSVPKFVGKELEVYGPFEEENIANLPSEIADLLISKGRAEEIEGE
ncbi:MAG: hypothetical protein Q7J54_03345 [Candidatus Woesearchaeota archaeon]|nr:hypothetical protein [Candidatus Woesearchaeota archaeon]